MAQEQPAQKIYSPALHACIKAAQRGDLAEVKTQFEKISDINEKNKLLSLGFLTHIFERKHFGVIDYIWLQMDEATKNHVFRLLCEAGHLELVKRFYDTCPNVNAKDINGNTALGLAFAKRHSSIVMFLCNQSKTSLVDLDLRRSNALELACFLGDLDAVTFLRSKFNVAERIAAFTSACGSGHFKVVESFCDECPDVMVGIFEGAKREELQKPADFYFFAALSFSQCRRNDASTQCLKASYTRDPEAFRKQLMSCILGQNRKCYRMPDYDYNRFLQSVLLILQEADMTPESRKSLYLEVGQKLLGVDHKYKKEEKITLYRSLLLLSQWRDTESPQIQTELATCLHRLLGLVLSIKDRKKITHFGFPIEKHPQDVINCVEVAIRYFEGYEFAAEQLAGLRNICEAAAHVLAHDNEQENNDTENNRKRGRDEKNNKLPDSKPSEPVTEKRAASKRARPKESTPKQDIPKQDIPKQAAPVGQVSNNESFPPKKWVSTQPTPFWQASGKAGRPPKKWTLTLIQAESNTPQMGRK